MPDPVEQALDAVSDEVSFLRFVQALPADFAADGTKPHEKAVSPCGAGPRGWENGSVDSFLESAAAWAEDSRGRLPAAPNPWRRCAEILHAGKFYE